MTIKQLLTSTLAAVTISLSTMGVVNAAPLGLTTGEPILTADQVYFDTFLGLSTFNTPITSSVGTTPSGLGMIESLILSTDPFEPTNLDLAIGGLTVTDDNGVFLEAGSLIGIGFFEDVIELQFSDLTGGAAADFGSSILALIDFSGLGLGSNPIEALSSPDFFDAVGSVTISSVVNTTEVPTPAAWLLLLTSLLGLKLSLRRKASLAA